MNVSGHKHREGFFEVTLVAQEITLKTDKWDFTKLKCSAQQKKVNNKEPIKWGGNLCQPDTSYMALISKSMWNKREEKGIFLL